MSKINFLLKNLEKPAIIKRQQMVAGSMMPSGGVNQMMMGSYANGGGYLGTTGSNQNANNMSKSYY